MFIMPIDRDRVEASEDHGSPEAQQKSSLDENGGREPSAPVPHADHDEIPEADLLEGEIVDETLKKELRLAKLTALYEQTTGLIPPPRWMREYEEIEPGSARIFIEAFRDERHLVREEQQHRHKLEERALNARINLSNNGQRLALIVALVMIFAGTLIALVGALTDHERLGIAGTVLVSTVIVGLVTVFITGRGQQLENSDAERGTGGDSSHDTDPGTDTTDDALGFLGSTTDTRDSE